MKKILTLLTLAILATTATGILLQGCAKNSDNSNAASDNEAEFMLSGEAI